MRFSRKWLTKGLVGSFALVFLTSCGLDLDNFLNPNGAVGSEDTADLELVSIGFNVDTSQVDLPTDEFGLAALSCTNVVLVGASSEAGYNIPQQVYTSNFKAVKGDKFLVKLISLSCRGVTYSVSNIGATDFDTWLDGDEGTLTNSDGSLSLDFVYGGNSCYDVDGCTVGDSITFTATAYNLGTPVSAASTTYEAAIGFTIGGASTPSFQFRGFGHRGFDVSNGRLKFSQGWECTSIIADIGGGNFGCGGTNFDAFKVIWVDDPAPSATPTADQMSAAILAATTGGEPTDQGATSVSQAHKVDAAGAPGLDISGPPTYTNGGVAIDEVLTADDAYGTLVKYACIYEGAAEGMACSKVTFDAIAQ